MRSAELARSYRKSRPLQVSQVIDSSTYCEYLRLQGHRVVQTDHSVWLDIRPRVFQPAPPFRMESALAREAPEALRLGGGLLCRWFTAGSPVALQNRYVAHTSVYVLRPPYDLDRIQSKARNQTRRGMERVQVRQERFDDTIAAQAFPVYADNVQRLGLFRSGDQMRQRWARWSAALSNGHCTEFWGAWDRERLVAFSAVVFSPWGVEIVCQRSLANALKLYPNNALVFRIASSVFERGATVLSYGLGEFATGQGGLDHFKIGMAFEEVRLQDHICWHPAFRLFAPLLTPQLIHALARCLRRRKAMSN
jgi:hypothetical protein